MAAYVQVLLLLCYVISIGKCTVFYSNRQNGQLPNNDGLMNSNIFSYPQWEFDPYYHYFNPGILDPYFAYPSLFHQHMFKNKPNVKFGFPNMYNDVMIQDPMPVHFNNKVDGTENVNEKRNEFENNKLNQSKNEVSTRTNGTEDNKDNNKIISSNSSNESKVLEMQKRSSGTNEVKNNDMVENTEINEVELTAKRDYLLVGNNGNNVYLLHENIPKNTFITNSAQPFVSSFVSSPYNFQQSSYPIYQGITSPPLSTTSHVAVNNVNLNPYNNGVTYASQGRRNFIPLNANGQLLQMSGLLLNSPLSNQGKNFIVIYDIPNRNIPILQNLGNNVYGNLLNAPNSPIVNQASNIADPISNKNIVLTNQIILNPYLSTNDRRQLATVSANTILNKNQELNIGNQNIVSPNVAGYTNNPVISILSAVALTVDDNPRVYQPLTQEKEAVDYSPDNVHLLNPTVTNSPSIKTDNNQNLHLSTVVEAQPLVAVTGFKETENKGNGKKSNNSEEKDNKNNSKFKKGKDK